MSKDQVVDFFSKLIFTEEKFTADSRRIGDLFYRYLVISAYSLEGFDSVFILVLGRNDGSDRLIWKYKGQDVVHEMQLDCGEYDAGILSCLDWLQEQTGYRSRERDQLGRN
jgi:hypothetical protein